MKISTIIILILVALALGIFFLFFIEKKLRRRLKVQEKDRNLFYQRKLKRLRKLKLTPEEFIDELNLLARDFFKEALDLSECLEYSELEKEFRNKDKKECITFSNLMGEISYSGKTIERPKLIAAENLFEKIVHRNRIPSEQDKKDFKEKQKEETREEKSKKKRRGIIRKIREFFMLTSSTKIKQGKDSDPRLEVEKTKQFKLRHPQQEIKKPRIIKKSKKTKPKIKRTKKKSLIKKKKRLRK